MLRKLKIEKNDVIKFGLYTIVFLLLFIGYNKANSPLSEYNLNSASTETMKSSSAFDSFETGKKKQEKPYLSISFKPDYLKVDDTLMKTLKLNIDSKYFKDKITPLDLVIDGNRIEPRGQVSGNKLILSSKIKMKDETVKVFMHELGHILDLYYLNDDDGFDVSDEFYRISWIAYNIKKKDAKIGDFVSGYALSNKYEDFAESFIFYIFHNEDFALKAKKNKILKNKYNFFNKYIFMNDEFFDTSFGNTTLKSYNWDSTKIGINLKKYLYYVR
ncbi:MAG: putative zinc-binding metallopeptidase [Candidatus Gracilibacteria bacterium]|nr:putative zinc-binding metallopeptidase [Candidatus Gracilibacteria bacterium]